MSKGVFGLRLHNLFRLNSLLHRVIDSHFKYEIFNRITIRQVRIIEEVFYNGAQGIRLKDLAERLSITSSAASQSVDSLVKVGMLERKVSESDRREVLITVSKSILSRYERHMEHAEKLLSRLLEDIPASRVNGFADIVEKIASRVEAELNFNSKKGEEK